MLLRKPLSIDLTKNLDDNSDFKEQLKVICSDSFQEFSELINNISKKNKDNIDWWVSSPANRNTLTSNLYLKFCIIKLIYDIENKDLINKIIVDSKNFKKVLSQIIIKKKIIVKNYDNSFLQILKLLKFTFMQFTRRILQLLACRLSSKKTKTFKNELTLIDTYVLPGFYSKDRYYNGLWDNLKNEDKKDLFFIPSIAYTKIRKGYNIIGNIYEVYRELRISKRPFLIKEDFINLFDIIYSVFFTFRVFFLNLQTIQYKNVDISPLFIEDSRDLKNFTLAIEGILNYRFIKNLNKNSLKINFFIDWWENQPVDKGYHFAISKYYPRVNSVGYLGYVPRNYELQLMTTKYEKKYGVIPDRIAVIGKSVGKFVKKLNFDQKITNAPAFRYSYLWSPKIVEKNINFFNILIALPINYSDSEIILKKILEIDYLKNNDLKLLLKPHPTMNYLVIEKFINKYSQNNIIITNENAENILKKSDLVISSMSIISLEAISMGIPTILIDRDTIIDYSPIPQDLDKNLWNRCKTSDEIIKSIKFYKNKNIVNNNKFSKIALEIKKNYFNKINDENINNLIHDKYA
mgnify:CR=1 FL=1